MASLAPSVIGSAVSSGAWEPWLIDVKGWVDDYNKVEHEGVSLEECMNTTKKAPIGTRWIDINKGDAVNPNYRSRLVAKEYKVDVRPELFAAPPPTECLRLLLSKAAECKKRKVLYIDVSRAYFYAKSVRPTYIKLPEEDPRSGEGGLVGKLKYSMYVS